MKRKRINPMELNTKRPRREIITYKQRALEAVRKTGDAIAWVSEELRNDYDVVYEAMKSTPCAIFHASPRLQKNPQIIRMALDANLSVIPYMSLFNRDICLEVLNTRPTLCMRVPPPFVQDKEIVCAFVRANPSHIRDFTLLAGDRDVVYAAVSADGAILRLLDKKFRADKEIVMKALETVAISLAIASPELRDDEDVVSFAVRASPLSILHASKRLRSNPTFLCGLLKKKPFVYFHLSEEMRLDRSVYLTAHNMPDYQGDRLSRLTNVSFHFLRVQKQRE